MKNMLYFKIKDRRFRMMDDGTYDVRSINRGKETTREIWRQMKFTINCNGYYIFYIKLHGVQVNLLKHRFVYQAHYPKWDMFDTHPDNIIDHINRDRSDSRIENLRNVTRRLNCLNCGRLSSPIFKNGKWIQSIQNYGEKQIIGEFDTKDEAISAGIEHVATLFE